MASPTLALIPAKRHSEGVPDKNWKPIINGRSCVELAAGVGHWCCNRVVLSTDADLDIWQESEFSRFVQRPFGLPDEMLAVVQHALAQVPGPDDEIIVLLQPTSPLRSVETVKQAIQMLEDMSAASSVVSVSESYPWQWSLKVEGGFLFPVPEPGEVENFMPFIPTRRQNCEPTYKRDGVVYAFRRGSVTWEHGNLYGMRCLPLFTPPAESLSIDTPEDWNEAVRRLAAARPSPASP